MRPWTATRPPRPTWQPHLCQSNDLHIDAVLEDEVGQRLLLIHAAWRHKDLDERRIAAFFDAPDRILTRGYAVTGGDQIP